MSVRLKAVNRLLAAITLLLVLFVLSGVREGIRVENRTSTAVDVIVDLDESLPQRVSVPAGKTIRINVRHMCYEGITAQLAGSTADPIRLDASCRLGPAMRLRATVVVREDGSLTILPRPLSF